MNNRALAGALQAQREKSNHLQMEAVCLLKQVDALLFERATMRYKHKQLVSVSLVFCFLPLSNIYLAVFQIIVLILPQVLLVKELRSNTMHQLSSMAGILSLDDVSIPFII